MVPGAVPDPERIAVHGDQLFLSAAVRTMIRGMIICHLPPDTPREGTKHGEQVTRRSEYLAGLSASDRTALERRLLDQQDGRCFICTRSIDLALHQVHVDHVDPLIDDGADDEHNFALTHSSCNQRKGASSLRVARCMASFDQLQQDALNGGERGANLGHLLAKYGGGKAAVRLNERDGTIRFVLSATGDETIHSVPVYHDRLSTMPYFFALLPIEYIHHGRPHQSTFHWKQPTAPDRGVSEAATTTACWPSVVGTRRGRCRKDQDVRRAA